MSEYTAEQVNSWFDDDKYEFRKIVYAVGETGWALDIGDGKAVIANVPLNERLRFKDIVVVTLSDDGRAGGCLPRDKDVAAELAKKETTMSDKIKVRIPDEREQRSFCVELEKRDGVLARSYDAVNRVRLTIAGHAIHAWLSSLDLSYLKATEKMTLGEFADAYSVSRGPGLRRFKGEQS